MQSQPKARKSGRDDSLRRKQAGATADDVFKGGAVSPAPRHGGSLHHPWDYGAGRLWPAEHRAARRVH